MAVVGREDDQRSLREPVGVERAEHLPYTLVERARRVSGASGRFGGGKTISSLGGELESFHFGFGDDDAYVIADLPDNEAAAALALTVNAAGGATVKTIALLTPEQIDEAANRSVDYRPPGS